MAAKKFAYMAKPLGENTIIDILDSGGSVFAFKYQSSTGTPVSDAVKFNIADRVHRLSLTASPLLRGRHFERAILINSRLVLSSLLFRFSDWRD